MSSKRRSWTAREKLEVLEEANVGGTAIAEVCRRHGISTAQFYEWRRRATEGALQGLEARPSRGGGPTEADLLRAELVRMRAVIAEVTAENLALKKRL
jgi:transposase